MKMPIPRIWKPGKTLWIVFTVLALVGIFLYLLPLIFVWKQEVVLTQSPTPELFPVTVNPKEKTIFEDPSVDAMLNSQNSAVTAAVDNASEALGMLASAIAATPLYQFFAPTDTRPVVISPGYRKEQAATAFSKILHWSPGDEKAFLHATGTPAITDGFISPGTYVVTKGSGIDQAHALLDARFQKDILSHYGTSTEAVVPLTQALTIASMLERETNDRNDMRIIAGIMWNRIFAGMKLQIDATLQYAKGTSKNWWPQVTSKDKYIKSPYNTYQNMGLPPAPISNPSTAAVLAALNPKKTSCLFYFHDKSGNFHCTKTYKEHVILLKKYYGQGK